MRVARRDNGVLQYRCTQTEIFKGMLRQRITLGLIYTMMV